MRDLFDHCNSRVTLVKGATPNGPPCYSASTTQASISIPVVFCCSHLPHSIPLFPQPSSSLSGFVAKGLAFHPLCQTTIPLQDGPSTLLRTQTDKNSFMKLGTDRPTSFTNQFRALSRSRAFETLRDPSLNSVTHHMTRYSSPDLTPALSQEILKALRNNDIKPAIEKHFHALKRMIT